MLCFKIFDLVMGVQILSFIANQKKTDKIDSVEAGKRKNKKNMLLTKNTQIKIRQQADVQPRLNARKIKIN